MVLAGLTEKPFEPLRSAGLKLLTLKMLFLLATASAHWVSERHFFLRIEPPFMLGNPLYFVFWLGPAFLPKTAMEIMFSSDIELSALYPEPSIHLEQGFHLMCPVRALVIYLPHTIWFHGQNRSLFIHWN